MATDDLSTLSRSIRAATERPHVLRARSMAARGIVPGTRQWALGVGAVLAWAEQRERAARVMA